MYVIGKPSAAMQTPPSAGPTMALSDIRSEINAETAVRSSRSTSLGVSASSAGRWKPLHADIAAPTMKISTTLGCGSSPLIARQRDPAVMNNSEMMRSRRRSMASAYAPPQSANSSNGTSCAAPSIPTRKLECVMANT